MAQTKERQEALERGKRSQEKMAALVQGHRGMLEEVRGVCSDFFRQTVAPPPYHRRPLGSVTLPCTGDPVAKVVLVPSWDRHSKRVDCSVVFVEVVVARVQVNGLVNPTPELALILRTDGRGFFSRRWSCRFGEEAFQRFLTTAGEFIRDPFAVFSRSSTHCCICRHALTDALSRGRGIGPECLNRAVFFRELLEQRRAETETAFQTDMEKIERGEPVEQDEALAVAAPSGWLF